MGDAAHVGSQPHEVFAAPYRVSPAVETRDTPHNYRRFPGGPQLPAQMQVWLVQKTGKTFGGVVSRSWGYGDSPDAEVIVVGFNRGKEYGAVGIGRHASFLQWGYSAPPSQMTDDGRRLFINCVHYIRHFDGKRPLIRRQASDRVQPIRMAMLMGQVRDDSFLEPVFPQGVYERYKGNKEGLIAVYQQDYELIYRADTGRYLIDEELRALGIPSNRQPATLEKLVVLLKRGDPAQQEAARGLLRRYTTEAFTNAADWRRWLEESRGRIYFSDVGGFKFRVVPEGYLDPAA